MRPEKNGMLCADGDLLTKFIECTLPAQGTKKTETVVFM